MSNRALSVGIVGAGQIVSSVHLPTLLTTEGVSVSWIADIDALKARALGRAYKVRDCGLPDDLTCLPEADVVLLAIPYGARDPYYRALRQRPCALYVEKPFSRTVVHHQEICAWFDDYRLGCAYTRRCLGTTVLAKAMLDARLFGEIRRIRFGLGGPGLVVGVPYRANAQLAGGGILFDVGVHGVDTVLFLTDAVDAKIEAATMIMDGDFDLHTDAHLVVTAKSGQPVDCQITVSCLMETINQLEITLDRGVLSYSLFSGDRVTVKPERPKGGHVFPFVHAAYPTTAYQVYGEHWRCFLSGLLTKQANYTSASSSFLTTAVIEKLYSAGQPVQPARGL